MTADFNVPVSSPDLGIASPHADASTGVVVPSLAAASSWSCGSLRGDSGAAGLGCAAEEPAEISLGATSALADNGDDASGLLMASGTGTGCLDAIDAASEGLLRILHSYASKSTYSKCWHEHDRHRGKHDDIPTHEHKRRR